MSAIAAEMPEEVEFARAGILRFAEKEVLTRHQKHSNFFEDPRKLYDENGRFSADLVALITEVRMQSAEAGFYGMCVPEALGGGGLGHLAYYAAWEALFHRCGPKNWLMLYALAHWAFGPSKLLEQMSEEAKSAFLPGLMDGSKSMCFGLTEPNAGSDASMLATKAVKAEKGWRLSGRKIWTTNAPIADFCVIFAKTESGITAFMVPTNSDGFKIQRVIRLFGHIGGDEAEISLDEVYVEPWQIVGELGKGFAAALYGVSLGRIYNSARSVGYGRWAIEMALDYAKVRTAFGQSISEYQGVSFPIADAATDLHAAHLMGINAALLLDAGELAVKELSMTKAFSVQKGLSAVDCAMQTHGAMGFTNELGLTEAWQALRVVNVADGTNEILKRTIVQRLQKGDLEL
ncbi:MAG: acyl-CoA dehydrogenase family protein [Pseudomonadales bacterium]|nr:acyl-CoA dehydrogenase family protein [Pseudomonadales bacterium]